MKHIVAGSVLVALLVPGAALAQKRPLATEDIYNLKDVRDPQRSPDGKWVAYVGGCDSDEEDLCTGTFVVSTSGGKPRRVSSDLDIHRPGT